MNTLTSGLVALAAAVIATSASAATHISNGNFNDTVASVPIPA